MFLALETSTKQLPQFSVLVKTGFTPPQKIREVDTAVKKTVRKPFIFLWVGSRYLKATTSQKNSCSFFLSKRIGLQMFSMYGQHHLQFVPNSFRRCIQFLWTLRKLCGDADGYYLMFQEQFEYFSSMLYWNPYCETRGIFEFSPFCGVALLMSCFLVPLFWKNSPARSFCWSGSSNRLPELGERVESVFHTVAMLAIEGFLE